VLQADDLKAAGKLESPAAAVEVADVGNALVYYE
jgi:hypothetical protein